MTDRPADDQAPAPADYQRAAAVVLHQARRDTLGWNAVVGDAEAEGRLSALIICLVNLVLWPGNRFSGEEPGTASSDGVAALERLATGMAGLDDDHGDDDDQ